MSQKIDIFKTATKGWNSNLSANSIIRLINVARTSIPTRPYSQVS